ncbi:MAG: TetR family transcriptional regulator [Gammaproteobacteria bacterium]|nr:TetR family transcriptional regulator [Gammaproteobacteria bacterium]NIR83213.1 TetR family transcriptional regulator [Gammaproteobacteria bacterium]NIR91021.1 TetR family transcriptional regulator [Gammaproteobacteria bacterium]NIU04378.1 TetR family transcriptional regulator [Gammaproteobacteria bacterium]NIV52601.1 TetR family transcriptional regulator [Gammaproteobacteria bacterium]
MRITSPNEAASPSSEGAQQEDRARKTPHARRGSGQSGARRDPAATRERILDAGRVEFSQHGYNGARIDRIARRSRSNIRMIYHYFGGKEPLYLAVLEDTYRRIRQRERQLDLKHLPPGQGMRQLVEFTFDYLCDNPNFVKLICNENLLQGKFLKKSRVVPETTLPLVDALEDLLRRGQAGGVFHKKVGPIQLYVTILSVCFTHLSNRHTLSIMFQQDLSEARWLRERRGHVVDVILSYLTAGTRNTAAGAPR